MYDTQPVADKRWWTLEKGQEHTSLVRVANALRDQDSPRREAWLRHVRMYGSYQAQGFGASHAAPSDRLRYNVLEQCVDTLTAEICQSKPKAMLLTDGGDFTLRQAAKNMDLLIDAQMRDAGIHDGLAMTVQRDAEITGTGLLYVWADMETLTVKCERVLSIEVLVDDLDARNGRPRQMCWQRPRDRGILLAEYAHDKAACDAIRKASRFRATDTDEWLIREFATEADTVLVTCGWHLRSGPKAKDGRYAVCIDGYTLASGEYTSETFPFIPLRWEEAMVGYWGVGVVARAEADQIELNRTLRRIQEAAGCAGGVWLKQHGAKLRAGHLTDVPGAIVEHTGPAPMYYQPQTVPGDLIAHADRIIQRTLQRFGISEAFSQAQKPAGLDSGVALRTHANLASVRQGPHAQRYEAWHVAIAKKFIEANQEIWKSLEGKADVERPTVAAEVKRGRRTVLKRLRFGEVNLPENKWVMQAYPTSSLPREPAGRLQTVQDWIGAGLIDSHAAKSLLDFPDVEGAMQLELADYDFALYALESMLEDAKRVVPDPYQQLDLAFELIRRGYLRAVMDEVPEPRLQLVRDHMAQIERLKAKKIAAEQKAVADAQAAMATPAASPMASQALPPDAALAPEMAGVVDPNSAIQVAA